MCISTETYLFYWDYSIPMQTSLFIVSRGHYIMRPTHKQIRRRMKDEIRRADFTGDIKTS